MHFAMFDQLAAFQSCPKSANFDNFDNFHKKMLILGNFGKLPIGQISSDLDKFCFVELTQDISS